MNILDGDDECDVCNTQKLRCSPICKTVGTRASKPLEIVHVDISPEPIESVNGFKYALSFVDSFSRLDAVYLLKSEDEVALKLEHILELGKPREIVSGNAKEFKFGKFAEVCLRNHIRQEFTSMYTPDENGKVERKWSTIGAMVRCILKTANLKETFWSFAIRAAAFHIKNRCIHSSHGMTSFEKFFGKPPHLNHLKVFGCKAFAFVEKVKRKKIDSSTEQGMLLGYCSNSKTYLIACIEKRFLEILQTRNVKFNESVFPGSESFHRRNFTNYEDISFE